MKRSPLVTLAAGAVLFAVLIVINLNVAKPSGTSSTGPGYREPPGASPAVSATPSVAPSAATAQITFAGAVIGGAGASIAIAVKGTTAVAYLCDGKRTEAWLQGTAANGILALTGAGGASLTGTFGNGVAAGTVNAASRAWTFSVTAVKPPSGLYRAAAKVRNANVVGGWIVLANGTQVGVLLVGDLEQPAPPLDLATGTTNVDGISVTVAPVDGSGL